MLLALRVLLSLYGVSVLVSMAGMEIFGWASAVLGTYLAWKNKKLFAPQFKNLDYALLALLGVVIVGTLLNTPSPVDYMDVIGSARWMLLLIGLRNAFVVAWDEQWFKQGLKLWAFVTLIMGLYAVVQHFTGIDVIRWDNEDVKAIGDLPWGGKVYRSVATLGSPMTYAHSVAMVICVLLGATFGAWKAKGENIYKWRWLLFSATFAGFLGLVCTYTRGAWLAGLVGGLFVIAVRSKRLLAATVVGLVLFFNGLLFVHPNLRYRFTTISETQFQSNSDRMTIWGANWEIFKDYPILGVGYGENERLIGNYYDRLHIQGQLGHAHNTFMQFLAGTGIIGFSLYLFVILFFGILTWREYKKAQTPLAKGLFLGLFAAQIAIQVGGLTECNFKDAEVNHLYLFLMAVVSSVSANRSTL